MTTNILLYIISYNKKYIFMYNKILIFILLSRTDVILFYLCVNMNIENRIKSIIKLSSTYTVYPFSSPSDVRKSVLGDKTFVNDDFINACKDNNLCLVQALIVHNKLTPNYFNSLYTAMKYKNVKIAKLLVEDGRSGKIGFVCFREIIQFKDNVENYNFYIMLFKHLPFLDGYNYRLKIVYDMLDFCPVKNWNMSIFKHTLTLLKTSYSNELGLGSTNFIKIMIKVLISGSLELVSMYFKVYYNLQLLLSFIDASVVNGLLDEFNFLLEYDTNNGCIYDMKSDIHRLLNIATIHSRPQFVKLFLSLIEDDTLSKYQLSFSIKHYSNMKNRFVKDIEYDMISCIKAYISDGRLDVRSEINNLNLTIKCIKKHMFHVFNYLLPYTDNRFSKEITERFCSNKSSYKIINKMFTSMTNIHTKFNNSTILLNFLESTRNTVIIEDDKLYKYYQETLHYLRKTNQFDSITVNNTLLKIVDKYNLTKNS